MGDPVNPPVEVSVSPGGSAPAVTMTDFVPLPPTIGSDGGVSRTTPSRSAVGVTSSGALTHSVSDREATWFSASVAVTVNGGVVPAFGGVPLRTPPVDSDNQPRRGLLPVSSVQDTAPLAPPTVSCWLYAVLIVAFCSDVVVTIGGPTLMVNVRLTVCDGVAESVT